METFYKVVQPDLTSFHDPAYQWRIGGTHRPATPKAERGDKEMCSDWYLYASRTAPQAPLFGARWPYRLLEVTGKPALEDTDKAAFRQLKVTREVDVAECFGPNGAAVKRLLEVEVPSITNWDAAGYVARDAAWYVARAAARDAARAAAWAAARDAARAAAWDVAGDAAWYAARDAAWYAARALVVADLVGHYGLERRHIDTLLTPWQAALKAGTTR